MRRICLTACLLVTASAAGAAGHDWQLAGKTYNSVAFVDLNSIASGSGFKSFTAIRVSGQPEADGWTSVVQQLAVNCSTRVFVDAGSRIEKTGGTTISFPGFGATQKALSPASFSTCSKSCATAVPAIASPIPSPGRGRTSSPATDPRLD